MSANNDAVLALSSMAALAARQRAAAAATAPPAPLREDLAKPSGVHDAHPYFAFYQQLPHQQNMLQDAVRTGAYQHAMLANARDFAGATVMDVGTGSGVLAWFATQAGAARVYAVEASAAAESAAALLGANGVGDRVTVVKAKVEDVRLPEGANSVDVLVSEPMGFMLLHEQMLRSYMVARQLFLKPGGRMFPSRGTLLAAPFSDQSASPPVVWGLGGGSTHLLLPLPLAAVGGRWAGGGRAGHAANCTPWGVCSVWRAPAGELRRGQPNMPVRAAHVWRR
jgi:hypothetical protein